MADIMDIMVQFLCQQNTASACQQFISGYTEPLQQLFFFLLLPIVFLIIFVYILSEAAVPHLKGKFRVLIGVVILAFIIIQGYYNLFLALSKLWIYVLVFIVGLWFIIKYVFLRRTGRDERPQIGGGGGGGQGGYAHRSGGGLFSGHVQSFTKGVTARTSKEFKDAESRLHGQLKRLEDTRRSIDTATDQQAQAKFRASFNVEAGAVEGEIARLREIYGDAVDPLEKELHRILGRR